MSGTNEPKVISPRQSQQHCLFRAEEEASAPGHKRSEEFSVTREERAKAHTAVTARRGARGPS